MKEAIKHYYPLILTVLCAVFAIQILFQSLTNIESIFSNINTKNNQTSVAWQITTPSHTISPVPKYVGSALRIGDAIPFQELFALQYSDETITPINSTSNAALYLIDIKSNKGTSILTTLSTKDIEVLEEIPSTAIYDKEKHLLYFYSSGIYTFSIRLYYENCPGVLFECQIPVEMR